MMTLDQIGLHHGTDKASNGHDYLNRYEPYFAPFRKQPHLSLVEIGVAGGASLRTWEEYFEGCYSSFILGIDHNPACAADNVMIGEASDPIFWQRFEKKPLWDIVIDDASHHSSQIIATFEEVWPRILPGGLYCCEDLHAAGYDAAYNRDRGIGNNAVNFFKGLIDYHVNENGANDCGKQTIGDMEFIHFYKSLVIIKKR